MALNIFPLFYYCILNKIEFRDIEVKELAEVAKKTRNHASSIKLERGIQTKQLKEGGVLSIIGKTTPRSDRLNTQKESTCDNGSKFKPVNHEQIQENEEE